MVVVPSVAVGSRVTKTVVVTVGSQTDRAWSSEVSTVKMEGVSMGAMGAMLATMSVLDDEVVFSPDIAAADKILSTDSGVELGLP